MKRTTWLVALASVGFTVSACALPGSEPADEMDHDAHGDSGDSGGGTFGPAPTTGETPDAGDEGDPTSGGGVVGTAGDESGGDNEGPAVECDIWSQDCPDGQKCMPYGKTTDSSWDATKCVPIDEQPVTVGDACLAVDHGASGFDNCDKGLMCWGVDPETLEGYCIAFCEGSPEAATCDDGVCMVANDGVLPLCLPTCDPLTQDCHTGEGCYPGGWDFICVPDASGDSGAWGDPCEYGNVCDPGLYCDGAAYVPGCTGSAGCCTNFCDINDDPQVSCAEGYEGGQTCVPWFAEGEAPPQWENVGGCWIPD